MDKTQLVDLLLVRVVREEEKNKVLELLIDEMGMSTEEAMEKIDNSPNILCEGIPMEQARILQNKLYPYVDLLPRFYASEPESEFQKEKAEEALVKEEDTPIVEEMQDSSMRDDEYEFDHDPYGLQSEEEDPIEVTSAAEEVLSVERCHICGRTPTSVQKLIPCRTCGDLTCSSCFNRTMHICEKCVQEGKTVDRPLDGLPEYKRKGDIDDEPVVSTSGRKARQGGDSGGILSRFSPTLIAIVAALAISIAFFMIDPLDLFSGDSVEVAAQDTVTVPDSIDTVVNDDSLGSIVPDTLAALPDSIAADSIAAEPVRSLRNLALPENLDEPVGEITAPRLLYSTPVRDIEIDSDSLPFLSYPVGYIAAAVSVELDAISLIRIEDDYTVFLISILHPEPVERRTALLSSLGSLLDSTVVDQMVLYYRESQYYEADLFSFIADSFGVISQSTSPYFLQRKQASIPETSAILSSSIFEWMTNLN